VIATQLVHCRRDCCVAARYDIRSLTNNFHSWNVFTEPLLGNVLIKSVTLDFWTLSVVVFLFKPQRFGDLILFPSSGKTCSVMFLNENRAVLGQERDDG
jgi:hypothetical protein